MTKPDLASDKRAFEEIKLVVFSFPSDDFDGRFAINTHKVREVVELCYFDKLPGLYAPYLGIMNLRGIPIPLLDIHGILNKERVFDERLVFSEENRCRVVVCETLGKIVGIVVGPRVKMYEFEDHNISPPTFSKGDFRSEYVSGIIEQDGRYIFMLDLETILENLEEDQGVSAVGRGEYQGKKVLLVEDSQLFQKKLLKFLNSLGFDVVCASNGIEGLDRLSAAADFDLILSDIEMPLMNGIEMIRRKNQISHAASIPVVFHTSITNPQLIKQVNEEQLGHYITKFDEQMILEKIRSLL